MTTELWDTAPALPEWAGRLGITRIADITALDVLDIPVVNAVVPASADSITVYSGKGRTLEAAVTSALMEAAERTCSTLPLQVDALDSLRSLIEQGHRVLDPRTLALPMNRAWTDTATTAWVYGHALTDNEPVLVPLAAAGYYRAVPAINPFQLSSSNGLAAGVDLAGAEEHALAEVIERHHWSLADLEGRVLPSLLPDGQPLDDRADERHPSLALDDAPASVRNLATRIATGGAALTLRSLSFGQSSLQPHVMLALLLTQDPYGPVQYHHGAGCSFDPETAAIRAITEAAQGRAVDVAAAREDLVQPGGTVAASGIHTQRAQRTPQDRWPLRQTTQRPFPSSGGAFPADDRPALVAAALELSGDHPPVCVHLPTPDLPFEVVRVVVPHLDSYVVHHSAYGARALERTRGLLSGAVLP